MSFLIKEITNIIEKNNSIIDEKYVGINYLEKIKYLIINSLKDSQDKSLVNKLASDLKEKNNQLIKYVSIFQMNCNELKKRSPKYIIIFSRSDWIKSQSAKIIPR